MGAFPPGEDVEGEDDRSALLPQGWPAGTVSGRGRPLRREVLRRAVQPARLERGWTPARAGRQVVERTARPARPGWPAQAPARAQRQARPGWPPTRLGAAGAAAVASSPPAPEAGGRAGQLSASQAERVARRGREPAGPAPPGRRQWRRRMRAGHPARLRSGRRRNRHQASPGHNPHRSLRVTPLDPPPLGRHPIAPYPELPHPPEVSGGDVKGTLRGRLLHFLDAPPRAAFPHR